MSQHYDILTYVEKDSFHANVSIILVNPIGLVIRILILWPSCMGIHRSSQLFESQ